DFTGVEVVIRADSDRLQRLDPFPAWDGQDFLGMTVLLKAQGKCTTDHISAAGKWLRYRGHLENISRNLFLGAVNAFTGQAAEGVVSVLGLADLAPDRKLGCLLLHADGSREEFSCTHSLSAEHIEWFHAGSALNLIGQRFRAAQA